MKRIFTKEVVIGLCVICALVILIIGIEFLKGVNVFKPANFYIAKYDNVAGLETAAPVTIDGYKVGQVREINFDYENPGKIEVLMALNKNLHLPVDSKAIIGTTLLSGAYIEIQLGKSQDKLPIGGTVETASNPDLMTSISNEVLPAVADVIPKVDSLLLSLNRIASDPALLRSIQNLEIITKNVESASVGLDNLMKRQVPGVISHVDGIACNLDTITGDLAILSAQLKALPLASTMDNVNTVTQNLTLFSERLNDKKSTLGLLMNDPTLYNNLDKVTADIDSLIVDIKRNPKRYISIKLL